MRKHILTVFLLSILTWTTANTQSLINKLQQLQKEVTTVDLGRYQYEQSFSFDADDPTNVTLNVEKTDIKRDKSESRKLSFNLALLNKNMVRRSSSKTEMKIAIRASKDIVGVQEEGEWEGYDDEIEILCQDIETAKSLEKLFKAIIPMASEYWETANQLPEQVDQLLELLTQEIVDIEIEENSIKQEIELDKDYADIVSLQQTDKEEVSFQFSLGDLNKKSVEYDVKNDKVIVSATTAKDRKFVLLEKEGELTYDDEIQFFALNPNKAAMLVRLLKKAIPMCDSLVQLRLPQPKNQAAAAELMQSLLISYSFNEDSYTQKISTDCRANYEISEEGEKETKTLAYIFNWGDIDPKSKEIKLSRDQIEIELEVKGKKKYIEAHEDGELKTFGSKLTLAPPTVEAARAIISTIDVMILDCPLDYVSKDIAWLDKNLAAIEEIEEEFSQNLSADSSDPCKLTLSITDKEDSEQYEFQLSTISVKKIELSIRGTAVELSMETKNDEKSINHYDEKGELSYEDEVEFRLPNVEIGRTALMTFRSLVEGCKEK